MSEPFNPRTGLILLWTTVFGPLGDRTIRLALDTGATSTVVNREILRAIGYEPDPNAATVQMVTGSGIENVPKIEVDRIDGLGQVRVPFSVIAFTLPASSTVDGVLGLDFLRGQMLTIDFRSGMVTLA